MRSMDLVDASWESLVKSTSSTWFFDLFKGTGEIPAVFGSKKHTEQV